MADITIRQARQGDAEPLSALGARTFDQTFGHLYSETDLLAFLDENHSLAVYEQILSSNAYHVLVAETADEGLAGFAVAGPSTLPLDDPGTNDGEIKRLYVDDPYQSAGIGTALFEPLLEWCKAQEFGAIYLSVYADNHGAQRFYRRYGFEKVKEYEFLVGEHRDPEFIYKLMD